MDNVATELDAPNEWWYDPSAAMIYYINNGTSAVPPPTVTFVALTRQVLINITRVTASPLTFRGLRFTGAAHTFLASHGVPSVRSVIVNDLLPALTPLTASASVTWGPSYAIHYYRFIIDTIAGRRLDPGKHRCSCR